MKENQILVITKHPGQPAQIDPLFYNELEAFQQFVGGYIETITFSTDHLLICNEEGKLLDLPYNINFLGEEIVGPCMIVGYDREGNFRSVKGSHVSCLMRVLNEWRGIDNA